MPSNRGTNYSYLCYYLYLQEGGRCQQVLPSTITDQLTFVPLPIGPSFLLLTFYLHLSPCSASCCIPVYPLRADRVATVTSASSSRSPEALPIYPGGSKPLNIKTPTLYVITTQKHQLQQLVSEYERSMRDRLSACSKTNNHPVDISCTILDPRNVSLSTF